MNKPLQLFSIEQLKTLTPLTNLAYTPLIARGLNVVFGPSGCYKSFYTLDLALQIARHHPVVYVAAEGSSGLYKRIEAWGEFNSEQPGQLHFVCEEINLRDLAAVSQFVALVKPLEPALIVFDTFARCLVGGDENTAKDTGLAIHHCAIVQRALGTAVNLVHHTNRAEKGERGSGAIRGAADSMIELAPTGDGSVKVSCSKLKDDEPWEPVEYVFRKVGNSGVLSLAEQEALARRITPQEMQIMEFMALEVFDESGVTARQLLGALNIHERHLYRMLSHLKHELTIIHDSRGDPYRLTVKGKSLICKTAPKISQSLSLVQ